jgi:hypothetical protein
MELDSTANDLSASRDAQTLAAAWNDLTSRLPEDWSDLLVEVELRPEESYEIVASIVSPLNPERFVGRPAFRFRVGHTFGYGAAASTVNRYLHLLDERGVRGRLRPLNLLAQRRPLETQGPVWKIGGRSL